MKTKKISTTSAVAPTYIRLPRTGERCPHSGLSRSMLNGLILPTQENNHNPPVASVVQKRRFASRGVRLVNRASLIAHLDSLAESENQNAASQEVAHA